MNSESYFAVWDLFTEVIGGMWLIATIGSLVCLYFCSKYNISMELTILILCLWLSVVVAITSNSFLWALVVLFLAGWFYYVIVQMRK